MIAIRNRLYSILLGGSLLPKCNLIFNWKAGSNEKVAGNTPKVLYPQGLIKDSDDHYRYDPTTTTYSENTVIGGYDIKDRQYTLTIISETEHHIDYTGNDTFLGGKAIAPYCKVDFEQVEGFDYNTANGTDDKIDSGIYIDEISKIETYVKAGNLSTAPIFFGSYDSVNDDSRLFCGILSDKWLIGLGDNYYPNISPDTDGWKKITLEVPVKGTPTVKFYIDDVLIDTITGNGTLGHFKLGIFGALWDSDINTWEDLINGSMRYFKIWTDDTLVFELIPKEDGKMYDVVSGTDKNTLGTGLTFTSEATEPTGIAPFKRINTDYNDLDNLTYEGFDPANVYRWNATELMRGVEWIKSLQTNWHLFLRKRINDGALEQMVVYSNLGNNNCLEFDGVNGWVNLDDLRVTVSKTTLKPITIRFKTKADITTLQYIIGNGAGSGFMLRIHNSELVLYCRIDGVWVNVSFTITPNTWYEATASYDGSVLKLNDEELSISGEISYSANRLVIGANASTTWTITSFFSGIIDYVIFETETDTHTYQFNQALGITVYDTTNGTPVNGTLNGGVDWVTDANATPTPKTTTELEAYKTKILKATKDKVTDVNDYALYINGNSAMLNQTGVPAEVGDTVSKIHSISNELIVSQTNETKQPMLQADGSLSIDTIDANQSLVLNKTDRELFYGSHTTHYWLNISSIGGSYVPILTRNYSVWDMSLFLSGTKQLRSYIGLTNTSSDGKSSVGAFNLNEWTLFSRVFDYGTKIIKLYINGIECSYESQAQGSGDYVYGDNNMVEFGQYNSGLSMKCKVGERIISPNYETDEEILAYFNKTKSKYGL